MSLTEQLRDARTILQAIVTDLPQKRDWLDPDVEKAARNFLAAPTAPDDAADEKRRADQLGTNCTWLIAQFDKVHDALCPGKTGTWQTRVEQAVAAAATLPSGACMFCHEPMLGGARCSHCGAL